MSFSFFPYSTRSAAQRPFPSDANNAAALLSSNAVFYPGSPDATTYTKHGGSWTSFDDGYNTTPIPLGFTWGFNGANYTECYVGTNGHITFGAGSNTISGTTNGIKAHSGDLWLNPALTNTTSVAIFNTGQLKTGINASNRQHGVWYTSYQFTQNSQVHNVFRIVVYCGRYGSDLLNKTEAGWRISLYKTNQHQFIEISLLDSSAIPASSTTYACGPWLATGPADGTQNSVNPFVFYSYDAGTTWVRKNARNGSMTSGVVQVTGPMFYAYENANIQLTNAVAAMNYVSWEYGDGSATVPATASSTPAWTLTGVIALNKIVAGWSPANQKEQAFWDVANSYNGSYKFGDFDSSGSISAGDVSNLLKIYLGRTDVDAGVTTRISQFLSELINTKNTVTYWDQNIDAASLIAEGGFITGIRRRTLADIAVKTYPGSSSSATISAPTYWPVSVGSYSAVPPTNAIAYNTSGFGTASTYFDTGYGYASGTSIGSNTTLTNTYYNLSQPSNYWIRSTSNSQPDALSSFNIYWNGTALNPNNNVLIGTYPNQYLQNYQSYTSGNSTYVRGTMQNTSVDKYGNGSTYYSIIYSLTFSTT